MLSAIACTPQNHQVSLWETKGQSRIMTTNNAPQESPPPPGRPLSVLRAMIDAIDHDVLQLLARRNGLVAEVAQYKREHARAIRDFQREREILDDRCDRARSLGLSPEMIESMYRLILWASRDRQAALRAEVPLDIEPKTVAIIGGKGAMGGLFARLFADLGHAVMVADVDTQLSSEEAASVADVVLISVPIDATEPVIQTIGPLVREDALLMDVTSIKTAPLAAMLASTRASVVGTHPLFGPGVHSVQGQRIVLTPGRGDEWLGWLKQMLHARGLTIMESTPEEHDRAMAIVQVLVHFATEVMGGTLAKLGTPIDRTLAFTSPIYLMELLMTARHFGQSPELYASIQMSNPQTAEVLRQFVESAAAHQAAVTSGDRAAFGRWFSEVHDFFGPFTEQALEQSSFLIDRLVERT
jgi:chorismate mutase/prephenate dehydrogenase